MKKIILAMSVFTTILMSVNAFGAMANVNFGVGYINDGPGAMSGFVISTPVIDAKFGFNNSNISYNPDLKINSNLTAFGCLVQGKTSIASDGKLKLIFGGAYFIASGKSVGLNIDSSSAFFGHIGFQYELSENVLVEFAFIPFITTSETVSTATGASEQITTSKFFDRSLLAITYLF